MTTTNTPALRFKEFDGEWMQSKFLHVFNFFSGYAFSSKSSTDNSGTRWLKIADVGIEKMNYSNPTFLPKTYAKDYSKFLLKKGDFVIALTRPILNGKLKVAKIDEIYENSLLNQRVAKIISKENYLPFIYSLLQRAETVNKISVSIAGTDPPNLSLNEVKNINIYIPSVTEQTKIADFLTVVDDKITELTQKHELLTEYKKGVMQQLFSQKIRFKKEDGSDFAEWEEVKIGSLLQESFLKGNKGNKAKKLTVKLWSKGVVAKIDTFQGSENTQYYTRKKGQLIYGKLDFLNCAFGLIPEELDGFESTIDAPAFDINFAFCHPLFLLERIKQKDFYKKYGEQANGSRKAKRINQSVFLAMPILLPSIEEQTKIAEFLSGIDEQISHTQTELDHAKTWKKGLLQKMFV